MKNIKLTFIVLLLSLSSTFAEGIDTIATQAYIMQYKDIAIQEMQRLGIPASITLAQGVHESSIGKSYLAEHTNNHFGIKCHENWTGKTFKYTDDAPDECFRVYDRTEDSYKDHSDFLRNRPRYAALFELPKDDYKGWAQGLKKAGYATNPKYADILIRTIEGFQLDLFDRGAIPNYSQVMTAPVIDIVQKEEKKEIAPPVNTVIKTKVQENLPIEKKIEVPKDMQSDLGKTVSVGGKSGVEKIIKINKRKAVLIANGESLELIGKILDIPEQDLLAYNDLTDASIIKGGQVLFIEKKRRRSSSEAYVVKEGDNLWSIAQKRGIQLTVLRQHNKLKSTEEPAVGEIIYLRGYIHSKPKLQGERDTIKAPIIMPVVSPEEKTPSFEKIRNAASPVNTNVEEPIKTTIQETNQPAPINNKIPEASPITPTTETKTVYPTVIEYDKLPKSNNGVHTVTKGDTMYNICKRYGISAAQIIQWNNLQDQNIKLGQVLKIQP